MAGRITGLALTALLAGCAASAEVAPEETALAPIPRAEGPAVAASPATAPAGQRIAAAQPYVLSAEERTFDCKKLTGAMQVRILQLNAGANDRATSSVSRTTQGVAAPILGGSRYAAEPGADRARDRAMLEAYNGQLKAKGCKTLDLAKELKG